jgi:protein-S-isoprenylcysteine O-methyltransferase Ste14
MNWPASKANRVLAALCIGAGFVADHYKHFPIIPAIGDFRFAFSALLLLLAGTFIVSGIRQLIRHNEHPSPYKPTDSIVSGGVYRFTRNPIYAGFLMIVIAIAIGANSAWLLLSSVALFLMLHFGVVKPEERYLAAKFGDTYDNYRRLVRGWI